MGFGSFLSGFGSLLGGISGFTKKEPKRWSIPTVVEQAKAAGVHPLAALGANIPAPTVSSNSVQSLGNAFQDMGAVITNRDRAKMQRETADLEQAKIRSEIQRNEVEAAHIAARTAKLSQDSAGQPSKGDLPAIAAYRQYVDPRDGRTWWGPSPDVPDLEQLPVPRIMSETDRAAGAVKEGSKAFEDFQRKYFGTQGNPSTNDPMEGLILY